MTNSTWTANASLSAKFRNLFKARDIFLHDGRSLRRFTIGAGVQKAAALAAFILLAWSAFASFQAITAMTGDVARMEAQVAQMQADVAVAPELMMRHYPFSRVHDANVLVFPNLASANTAYKLLSRLGGAEAIGPILVGMAKPIHVLATGADVRDIVNVTILATIDAQFRDAALP